MRAYTVHAPPQEPPEPETFAFVKDGFSWPALFVPLIWFVWHRLWLPLLPYLVCLAALVWIGQMAGPHAGIVGLLGAVLVALEANNIRRWSLNRRGWREIGGSFGQNLDEAEARFFQDWARAPQDDGRSPARRPPPPFAGRADGDGEPPVLGLFPEPER